MELLILSLALDLRGGYKSFKFEDICMLVEKFYLENFSEQERTFESAIDTL